MQNNLNEKRFRTTDTTAELIAMSDAALMDCAQAAHYLNLSESYIRKAVASNKIPFARIGTRTLFRRSDLDEWVNARIVQTNDDISSRAQSLTASVILHKGRTRNRGRG